MYSLGSFLSSGAGSDGKFFDGAYAAHVGYRAVRRNRRAALLIILIPACRWNEFLLNDKSRHRRQRVKAPLLPKQLRPHGRSIPFSRCYDGKRSLACASSAK